MEVSERIKYFRQMNGITVNKLANLSGVSQSYLRDLELGKKQPTVEYLSYICDALGITLEKFFSDDKLENELNKLINNLNHNQKNALIEFLKSMSEKNKTDLN